GSPRSPMPKERGRMRERERGGRRRGSPIPPFPLSPPPSPMAVTLNDVAVQAGVSVSTASRVLTGQAAKFRISPETEQAVRAAAEALSYRVNHLARGLRLRKTNTLGVVAPDLSNPFFAHIVK